MNYTASQSRYETMKYNRCGRSGLHLPALSLGLWKNFGSVDNFADARGMLLRGFDLGITHFDLANNYGPVYGSAEETFGMVISRDLAHYRDEILVATKAGYDMWDGPYGNWGSRKYLIASLNQSLERMKVDYVDIFYHHRPDPETPLDETLGALEQIVKSGKALYVGLSRHSPEETGYAKKFFDAAHVPFIIHQSRYSLFDREIEKSLLPAAGQAGIGVIVFSPLAQGLLSGTYLNGIPERSRAARFKPAMELITPANVEKVKKLNDVASARGQSITQMALSWVLRDKRVCSAIIGASSVAQVEENVAALNAPDLSADEIARIDSIMKGR
jgi:L-glyceraldehyde 3-phosphate reductase